MITIEPALKKRKLDEAAVVTASTDETGPVKAGSAIENQESDGNQIKESKRSKKGQNKVKSDQSSYLYNYNLLHSNFSLVEQRSELFVTTTYVKLFTTGLLRHQFALSRSVSLCMILKST